ncbi:hypothetical protein AJ78_01862 [Emergomyces pasteurianus Ep9510]|uniref:Seipin n=1 Tax=Emergomyces pasteurianus Ep9510 TaxID=1447872 RepID=A0A1J9PQB6_9EURO|nr:hypothetical protein AJ78_01862 [Emergomyces pasteurianus Ep9510]
MDDDTEPPNQPLYLRALTPFTEIARTILSKPARRAYINTFLFALTSFALCCISIVAYWIFYYKYVPQIGLERQVHLQFGDGHPYGTARLGIELICGQPYDVTVALYLPRTPSNLAAGNFMLDLALFSTVDTSTNTSTETNLIARSRRPAILTYASPIVDMARRVYKMPLYVLGWQKEAEDVKVHMMERLEFEGKKEAMPRMLRLEIQSEERMQVYNAVVRFDARFSGLRWIMYNWRILSFFILSSTFWIVSMICMASAWIALAIRAEPTLAKGPKSEDENGDGETSSDISIKEEGSDEEDGSSKLSLRRRRRTSSEAEQIKQEEDIEEPTMIQPLAGEGPSEIETDTHPARTSSSSQATARGNLGSDVQRRRSHVRFEYDEDEA